MAERISFTRPSAERIARAVRAVENTRLDGQALSFRNRGVTKPKVFRICTFTGAWSIGAEKTVTFKYQTAAPNTASATNLFFPITNTATNSSHDCAIAKDGTAWYLVDVKFVEGTAVFVTSTQRTAVLTDVTLSASLNTSACTISIGKTLVTASRIFVTGTATGTYLMLE